jgi:serine/threonine protein kinase
LIKPRLKPKPHLVLEYVDGTSLDKLIGKLSIEEACRIAFDIARALEYAHSKHIIHCDLKPKNILVSKLGEAKVTDFGLATGLGSSLKGLTLAYAAPEIIRRRKPDERTDIYQLGLIFYEMITGVNPFVEGDGDIEDKILNHIPDPPSKFRPEVEPLDDIIMRCLSKNPKERPSLSEFREAIYDYMKKFHDVSLHLTKDYETMARKAVRLAFYAAKQNDLKTALAEMEFALSKARVEIREDCNAIVERLRHMLKEGMNVTEELLMMIETLMKKM